MWIQKGELKIIFNQRIKTTNVELYRTYINPEIRKETGLVVNEDQSVNINTMHKKLGHTCEATTRSIMKILALM